ncbi:MAG TPA: hypothetical protein VJ724_00390 [Tahibacter sp.]|nr:hypothetical protein [Tahibacter sp.]
MHKRRIAVVGLGDDATHAFRSMLKILDGHASAAWELSTPDHAEVLMAGVHSNEPVVAHWARTDKPLIAVYEGGGARPGGEHTLCHPFRVMQLLGVLDDVERQLDAPRAPPVAAPVERLHAGWAFAESLRRLARNAASGSVHAAAGADGTLFVHDDLSAYRASAALLRELVQRPLELPALEPATAHVPDDHSRRPVVELYWFSGLYGPGGLAPWLDRRASHRLRRWPDFGLVRGTRAQLALAAALSRDAYTVEHLAQATRQPAAQVENFLNACSLTGILASSVDARPPQPPATTSAPSRFGNLIRGLRQRLGLSG